MSRVKMAVARRAAGGGDDCLGGGDRRRRRQVEDAPERVRGGTRGPDRGRGQVQGVKFNRSDETIDYRLSYSGLEGGNVLFAHIHFGQELANGGVAAFLCGGGDEAGSLPGRRGMVSGTIAAADIQAITARASQRATSTSSSRAIRRGLTYANVHTTQSPGGEIRGQIGTARTTTMTATTAVVVTATAATTRTATTRSG